MSMAARPKKSKTHPGLRGEAEAIFMAGVRAVDPEVAVKRWVRRHGEKLRVGEENLALDEFDRIIVVGAGKAGAPMAKALEDLLGDRLDGGWVNVKYGHLAPTRKVHIHEAGHPVPDAAGLAGAEKILEILRPLDDRALVFCVISGGGSALLPAPASDLTLEEKQETTRLLLACGANIHEMNAIRKHISRVKGGRLAQAAYPARTVSLLLSDVIGDRLDVIASGPTVADESTFAECLSILDRYELRERIPERVRIYLERGAAGHIPETPKPGDPIFEKTTNRIVGSNAIAIRAAADEAAARGFQTLILSTFVEGETREVAKVHAAIAKEVRASGNPVPEPACILSGGETTVTLRGSGRGGRNQEFALAAAIDIEGMPGVCILSGGTDGTDGPTDAAGGVVDGKTLARAQELQLDPYAFLRDNNSYAFLEAVGGLLKTGPTNTNVMDLRIILVDQRRD